MADFAWIPIISHVCLACDSVVLGRWHSGTTEVPGVVQANPRRRAAPGVTFGETNPPGKTGRTKPTPSRAYFENRAKHVRRRRLAETEGFEPSIRL
jgi:hypothetical protein